MIDPRILHFAKAVHQRGGRALIVGGWVRDHLFNHDSKDMDVEVFGLPQTEVESILKTIGPYEEVGKSYGVYILKGLQVDIALPRKDTNLGPGHKAFKIDVDPQLSFAEASKRRDFTINSMGYDPLTCEVLDPHGGQEDYKAGTLRATDPTQFADDPLRGLRAAQFAARFDLKADTTLLALCAKLDLSELAAERMYEEFRKLLLKSKRPSVGLTFLRDSNQLRFFPELEALIDVPQTPLYHPEGDVWIHTLMVIDEAAKLRLGDEGKDLVLMFATLCHDFGKPLATQITPEKITSHGHEEAGVEPTQHFLNKLKAPKDLVHKVTGLVTHHLAPFLLVGQKAKDSAYRRLARKLDQHHVTMLDLAQVARADHLGRTTPAALRGETPDLDIFMEKVKSLDLETQAEPDVVTGKFLLSKGYTPGPQMGNLLARCRELQDETGLKDPEELYYLASRK